MAGNYKTVGTPIGNAIVNNWIDHATARSPESLDRLICPLGPIKCETRDVLKDLTVAYWSNLQKRNDDNNGTQYNMAHNGTAQQHNISTA